MKESHPKAPNMGKFDEYLKNQFQGTDSELKRRLQFKKQQLAAPASNRFKENNTNYMPIANQPYHPV